MMSSVSSHLSGSAITLPTLGVLKMLRLDPFFLLFAFFLFLGPTTFNGTQLLAKTAHPPTQWSSFDIDDNILFTDAKITIENSRTGEIKGFTTQEWAAIRNQVGEPGPYKDFFLTKDSFTDFSDSEPLGILTFRKQLERTFQGKGLAGLKGPSWEALQKALKKPENAFFITARGHSREAILEGFRFLYEKKMIPSLPKSENIFAVVAPDFPPHLKGTTSSESKLNAIAERLDLLQKLPLHRETKKIPAPSGKGMGQFHTFGFSDDDWENFTKARDGLLQKMADTPSRWNKIKISLFYTGTAHPGEKPQAIVLKPQGGFRPLLPKERLPFDSHMRLPVPCTEAVQRAAP